MQSTEQEKNYGHDLSLVKELIREAIDPIVLLEYYGVEIGNNNHIYDKIRCPCPIHKGDSPTAFSFELNSKLWTCYTRHCGDDTGFARDIYMFIQMMEERKAYEDGRKNYKCSFPQALKIASELSGIPIDETTSAYNKEMIDKLDNQKWIRQMSKVNQEIELDIFDETEIELFKAQLPLCDYIGTRNFTDDILDFFEIGFSSEGIDEPYRAKRKDFSGRIVFPVRDAEGRLVGWSGRLATDDKSIIKAYNKYMHKLDFDKGFVLYNFNHARKYVKELKTLIIVEGNWDVMRLWSYGICNVVAVLGSNLTPEQLSLAVSSAIKIVVFLDGDGAGKVGATRICEQLKRYVDVYEANAGEKDPDDLTHEEAWNAINNAKRYVSKEEKKDENKRKYNRRSDRRGNY